MIELSFIIVSIILTISAILLFVYKKVPDIEPEPTPLVTVVIEHEPAPFVKGYFVQNPNDEMTVAMKCKETK
jgi:hypothetical protein